MAIDPELRERLIDMLVYCPDPEFMADAVVSEIEERYIIIDKERWERVRTLAAEEVRVAEWEPFSTQEMADALNALQPGDIDPVETD